MTRFLAAGYVTVIAGFRSPDFDALTADSKQWLSQGVTDLQAMIRHVKAMPQVSPDSVAVYGCSGGGGLALGVAGEIDVAAVAGEEPNFGWYYESWMANNLAMFLQATEDPHRFFTSAVRRTAREKLRTISSPIFIAQGDQLLGRNKIISEIWLPDLKATQEEVEAVVYPGQRHCFGFYAGTSAPFADDDARAAGRKFFEDMNSFFKRHLPTQPVPLEEELVR